MRINNFKLSTMAAMLFMGVSVAQATIITYVDDYSTFSTAVGVRAVIYTENFSSLTADRNVGTNDLWNGFTVSVYNDPNNVNTSPWWGPSQYCTNLARCISWNASAPTVSGIYASTDGLTGSIFGISIKPTTNTIGAFSFDFVDWNDGAPRTKFIVVASDGSSTIVQGPTNVSGAPPQNFAARLSDAALRAGVYITEIIAVGEDGSNEIVGLYNFSFLTNPVIFSTGPSSGDTIASLRLNAASLRKMFELQSVRVTQGLAYDCTVYDQKNICVSFVGSKSGDKGIDATSGALIVAHKLTNNFRLGGYIDQSSGSRTSGGLTLKKNNPGFGAFGVWSQNADGSGIEVRASANVGKADIDTTRTAIDSAEAGFGKSHIKSNGFHVEVSRDYTINNTWSARPYLGYRKTTNKRAGYSEVGSDDVTAPLTYSSLNQNSETVLAGVRFGHQLSQRTSLTLSAGLEHDIKNDVDRYHAINADIREIDSIDMASNNRKTRPTLSFGLNHAIDKTQRVGISVSHRKEAFRFGSSTTAMIQYSKGF